MTLSKRMVLEMSWMERAEMTWLGGEVIGEEEVMGMKILQEEVRVKEVVAKVLLKEVGVKEGMEEGVEERLEEGVVEVVEMGPPAPYFACCGSCGPSTTGGGWQQSLRTSLNM